MKKFDLTQRGFTLVELVIVVAVIAILTAIVFPNYRNYVIKSKITEATQALSDYRVKYEQFFLDNRTYPVGSTTCLNTSASAPNSFDLTCVSEANTYTITATGKGQLLNYNYSINQANVKQSSTPWGNSNSCWVNGAGGLC